MNLFHKKRKRWLTTTTFLSVPCYDGRELHHIRTETKEQAGYTHTFEMYGCANCSDGEYKAKCLYKYNAEKDAEKNKVMKINEQWETLKEESHVNSQSEKGILNRQIHFIQTEGHFGDIKENGSFRRFRLFRKKCIFKNAVKGFCALKYIIGSRNLEPAD